MAQICIDDATISSTDYTVRSLQQPIATDCRDRRSDRSIAAKITPCIHRVRSTQCSVGLHTYSNPTTTVVIQAPCLEWRRREQAYNMLNLALTTV